MTHVRSHRRLYVGSAALLTGLGGFAFTSAGAATPVPVVAQPVVQAIPGGEGMKLNAALGRLAQDPRDVDALIDAGRASLDLGDVDAAIGFYQRAGGLAPHNGRAKAGLAGAYVLKGDPFSAIPLFAEAEQAGTVDAAGLADRGLASDLVGDNAAAQQYYRRSLALAHSDETVRRLALSLAIAGDRRGMELALSPLLAKQDKIAWRTRAFALAILGAIDEADGIARQSLPPERASAMTAYLRYMPRLTAAQQAAACNLGRFPRAAEIGIDDPRVARYAKPRPTQVALGPGLAAKPRPRDRDAGLTGATAQPFRPLAAPVPAKPAAPVEPSVSREVAGAPLSSPVPDGDQPRDQTGELAPVAAAPAVRTVLPVAAPLPAAKPPIQPSTQPALRLEDVFADFTPPSREAEPQAGAVDLRRLTAKPVAAADVTSSEPAAKDAKSKALKGPLAALICEDSAPAKGKAGGKASGKSAAKDKADRKADRKGGAKAKDKAAAKAGATQCKDVKSTKQPTHPSRIWVQIAAGKKKKALAFDWGRFTKEDPGVFKGRKGYTSAWGATNRLLTGPFESEAAANAYLAKLKKAGVDAPFVWISPAGQVVDTLP